MKHFKTVLGFAITLPFLAACIGPDLDTTRGLKAKGSNFNKALYKEYLELAVLEDDEADVPDAEFFNDKAVKAASGAKVGPQASKSRKLPGGAKGDIKKAEKALLAALKGNATKKAPNHAARAQAMFDCWLQEQEENDQPEDIARCRAGFEKALKKAEAALAKKAPAKPKKKVAAKPKKAKPPVEFLVLFDFDSAKLDSSSKQVVKDIVSEFKKGRKAIHLVGHTDRAGNATYNMTLSKKRVTKVKAALIIAGVPVGKIKTEFFGEQKPRVSTSDGIRSAGNRRVAVTVK